MLPDNRLAMHVEFVTGFWPELVGEELIANSRIMHSKVLLFRNWLNKSFLFKISICVVPGFLFLFLFCLDVMGLIYLSDNTLNRLKGVDFKNYI